MAFWQCVEGNETAYLLPVDDSLVIHYMQVTVRFQNARIFIAPSPELWSSMQEGIDHHNGAYAQDTAGASHSDVSALSLPMRAVQGNAHGSLTSEVD